ncbi:MAG: divergent polysaccharide deacetylase family protein [Alphaproteobacteria bacterium]|nr:divergent polysaccharide deacetylase family protein [Alphaproteobacteria bacterium]
MAATSMISEGSAPGAGRAVRALALAYLVVFVSLALLAGAIAIFGSRPASDGAVRFAVRLQHPRVARALPPAAASAIPPAAQPAAPPATPPAAPVAAQPVAPPPQAAPAPPPMPPAQVGHVAVADPALIEQTPQGPLPRIAADGRTPMRVYGFPLPAADKRPRVAIVIGGLGISAKATQAALDALPPGVTLAFAPYANDVQRWVTMARQRGHEILLQVPMEPYDFPDSDPGQYTLRVGGGEDSNTKRLVWALTRFTGYVGATNLLGGRMLSDAAALEPVLTYLTRRGLLFVDNGSASHSTAPDVAARVGIPFDQATDTIDTIQAAMEIDHNLSDLESAARAKGSATGTGFLYPVTIERVTVWARGLSGRGLVLAPISAVVSTKK